MKKLILFIALLPLFAHAQIPAANDTTLITGSTSYTPQNRFTNVTLSGVNYRIPQVYNPIAGKYDTYVTAKYLRAFYAPLVGGGYVPTTRQILNGYGILGGTQLNVDITKSVDTSKLLTIDRHKYGQDTLYRKSFDTISTSAIYPLIPHTASNYMLKGSGANTNINATNNITFGFNGGTSFLMNSSLFTTSLPARFSNTTLGATTDRIAMLTSGGDLKYLPGNSYATSVVTPNDVLGLSPFGRLGATQPNAGFIFIGDSNLEGYPLSGGVGVGANNWATITTRAIQKYQGPQSDIGFSDFNDPTRYGITLGGTTIVVNAGPVNRALQMTPGSTITFTAPAVFVEFWYNQSASAGSIELRCNGTLYRTINASGPTLNNVSTWSFDPHVPTPSGGANATFELKCVGANVIITSLFKNIQISQINDTYYFLRNAVSGDSFQDFNLTNISATTGLIPSSNAINLVALGTNSIYSASKAVDTTQFKADLISYINALRNSNSKVVYVIPPRSLETSHSPIITSYANYYTAIQNVIKQYTLPVIDLTKVIGYGFDPSYFAAGDDLHYSAAGHQVIANYVIDQLSKLNLTDNVNLATLNTSVSAIKLDTGIVRTTTDQTIYNHKNFNGQVSFGGWDGTGVGKKLSTGVYLGTAQLQAYDFTGGSAIPLSISASQIDFTGTSTFKGATTISYANPDVNGLKIEATTGTNASGLRFGNTGGNYYIGADNNIGSRIQNGTAKPYAFVFNAESARDMIFMTNNTSRMSIDGTSGVVNAPALITTTQSTGDNSAKAATTAYVDAANATNANLTGPVTSVGNATSISKNIALNGISPSSWNSLYNSLELSIGNSFAVNTAANAVIITRNNYVDGVGNKATYNGNGSKILLSGTGGLNYQFFGYKGAGMAQSQTTPFQVDSLGKLTVLSTLNGTGANLSGLTASQLVATDASKNLISIPNTIPSQLRLTGSGTGAATTISIPHGLSGVSASSIATVQPINAASAGVSYITTDATNVNIVYTVAPASGTNNLSYNVSIKP